ncbi:MAG: hypothetical protein DWQ08_02060 [Proteobacteria bacterium]|nr:MAG: hypothetical protein DWQ08_02060 [Pseudomonadota bacterium]
MELQTALILLGVVALAVVFAVSWFRDRGRRIFHGKVPKVPPVGGSLVRSRDFFFGKPEKLDADEPTLGRLDEEFDEEFDSASVDAAEIAAEADTDLQRPGRPSPKVAPSQPPATQPPLVEEGEPMDAPDDEGSVRQLDYWVRISGDEPVERDQILSIYREHEYLLEHAHTIHGRAVPDGKWCDIEHQPESTSFTDLVMTLQLCDRGGPVTESELTRFNNLVFALAESLDRQFKFQGTVEEALAQAVRLDRFCQDNDVFAIINICGEGDRQFKGQEVLRAVEGSGMRYGDLKVFHGPDSANGEALYSLANMVKPGFFELDKMKEFSTPGLTMFMSVPRCASPADVFTRMAYVAGKISNQLGGVMLDQKKQMLDDASVKQIRRQVEEMGQDMTRKGMAPGSEEALRLF